MSNKVRWLSEFSRGLVLGTAIGIAWACLVVLIVSSS